MNEMRPPNADLATDTELVRGYVEILVDAGRNVIAIMHSYGGAVGTNALCGLSLNDRTQKALSGGVSHLIYLCALHFGRVAPWSGRSKNSVTRTFCH